LLFRFFLFPTPGLDENWREWVDLLSGPPS
jgi:hypothetical protein